MPEGDKPADKPAGLTKEEASELFNELFNAAIGPRLKRAGEQIVEEVSSLLNDRLDTAPPGDPKKGKGDEKDGNDKRITALETELAESKARELEARKREKLRASLKAYRIEGLSDFTLRGILSDMEESGGEFFVGDKPLDTWAKEFARTDEGKRYIPAKPGTGTGSRPGIDFTPKHEPGSLEAWEEKTNRELYDALRGSQGQ